jgi:triphosphatase
MVAVRKSPPQASEIELKLEFLPTDAARLAAHPALAVSLAPPEEQELLSTYFDTPDCALHEAGVYLRVRECGGRYLQTVKAAASKTELLERLEWQQAVSSSVPDLAAVEGTALKPLLTPEIRASLQPMFETRIRRRIYRVARDDSEIEVAIDQGEISTRDRSRPICELELELKRGERKELFRLARLLAEEVPFRLEVKTKAERGYELVRGGPVEAEKAAEVDIGPELTCGEAFRIIALSCLRQIVANEPATCAGRAEALHQMRIGLRRLRAAIAIFADVVGGKDLDKIKTELKWITRQLGPARDLDVFAADVLAPLREKHPEHDGIVAAHQDFEEKRASAYATARAAIQSDRFRGAMLDLAEWIECGRWATEEDAERQALRARPVAEHAEEKLGRLRKRIKKKGAALRDLGVAQRHRLRIRAKRLRYATEFFASTFPGETRAKRRLESLSALKDLQDALGGLNDLATHRALIAEVQDSDQRLVPAETRAEALLSKAERAFARFAETRAFWKA